MNPPETRDLILSILTVALGASGTYLLLPHKLGVPRTRMTYAFGAALAALAVALLATFLAPPGEALNRAFFYAFAIGAVASGLLMVTGRDPVHCALWFAAVVLSTSGLFLLAGAQFLAAGTVIVYAGAIIVTFLFVIMLAQQQGRAVYDRAARAPLPATLTCFALLWALLYALTGVKAGDRPPARPMARALAMPADAPMALVVARAIPTTARLPETRYPAPASPTDRPPSHVAGLGGTLFADHLIAVEVAGVLLFIALVAALMIIPPKPPIRPGRAVTAATAGPPRP